MSYTTLESKPFLYLANTKVLISLLLFLPLCANAKSLSFNFFTFNNVNQKDLKLEGSATISNKQLELNRNQQYSNGRVLYRDAVELWYFSNGIQRNIADFTTWFSFDITASNLTYHGDGLTFLLVPESSYDNWRRNETNGGLLGLFDSEESAINDTTRNQVVAVEFDTANNRRWDPSNSHIGIDVNSIISKVTKNVSDGLINRGTASASVSYNSTTHNLSASLSFDGSSASYDVSYIVDLSNVLPQRVHVGFTGATGSAFETHKVYSWSFDSRLDEPISPNPVPVSPPTSPSPIPSSKNKVGLIVGITSASIVFFIVGAVALYWFKRRKSNPPQISSSSSSNSIQEPRGIELNLGPKKFSYSELLRATTNFAKERKLGEGGFGEVYEGLLTKPNMKVAVKRFRGGSNLAEEEFVSEVKIISKLSHKNLVRLLGWCHGYRELLLVYELMPNRSLDFHLYGDKLPPLPWPTRYNIALGLSSAMYYLRYECDPCVVHRDIKPSNVMLDSNFRAKLGDFGLAGLADNSVNTMLIGETAAGTPGYVAPEVMWPGIASKDSDTYSFGVVALELACGRRSIDRHEKDPHKVSIIEWIWDLYEKGDIVEAIDKKLNQVYDDDQARRLMVVGLWCCNPNRAKRPSIKEVMDVLNSQAPEPILPPNMMTMSMYMSTDSPSPPSTPPVTTNG